LQPEPGEIVLAVNLFGVREAKPWRNWQRRHPDVCLVEDHTHDPFSDWAASSTADYAIASLRKTLPVPDGAVLWSPKGNPLPVNFNPSFSSAAALLLSGMILKKSYLETGATNEELYRQMRLCQKKGEERLSSASMEPISSWSATYLAAGVSIDLRSKRERNARGFLDAIACSPRIAGLQPIFRNWRVGQCPLNPVLLFDNSQRRDGCRASLLKNRIYAAVHWPPSKWLTPSAADIASRVLTIPLDFRCAAIDHPRILAVLRKGNALTNKLCRVA
jgi:hypothetical protein